MNKGYIRSFRAVNKFAGRFCQEQSGCEVGIAPPFITRVPSPFLRKMDRMNLHTKCYDSSKGYLNWPASAVRRSGWGSTLQWLRQAVKRAPVQNREIDDSQS
jgi:hypothetical protein